MVNRSKVQSCHGGIAPRCERSRFGGIGALGRFIRYRTIEKGIKKSLFQSRYKKPWEPGGIGVPTASAPAGSGGGGVPGARTAGRAPPRAANHLSLGVQTLHGERPGSAAARRAVRCNVLWPQLSVCIALPRLANRFCRGMSPVDKHGHSQSGVPTWGWAATCRIGRQDREDVPEYLASRPRGRSVRAGCFRPTATRRSGMDSRRLYRQYIIGMLSVNFAFLRGFQ
jgi:hypothetical protein